MASNALKEFFANTDVSSIPLRRDKVLEFTTETPLEDAFQGLVDYRVQAAPVWDDDAKQYIGFLAIRDLVSFIVYIGAPPDRRDVFIADIAAAADEQGVTITYLARRNRFQSVNSEAKLGEVAKCLTGKGYIKRVAVLNADGKVANLVSQTSLLDVFFRKIDLLPESLRTGTVKEIFAKSFFEVYSVNQQAPTLEAFKILDNKQVTGVAVIDDSGAIVSCITGKDLKQYVKNPSFDKLTAPVISTLESLRQDGERPNENMFLTGDATVEDVVGKLIATRYHRVYIIDGETKPVGVVSLRDVLDLAV